MQKIPLMRSEMKQAKQQARDYGDALKRKYNDLRLKQHAVVGGDTVIFILKFRFVANN